MTLSPPVPPFARANPYDDDITVEVAGPSAAHGGLLVRRAFHLAIPSGGSARHSGAAARNLIGRPLRAPIADEAAAYSVRRPTREALRDTTREVHERLHAHAGFVALLDGVLSIGDYRRLLARLYGFHRPLEEAMVSVPREWWLDLDPEPRRSVHRLEHDLATLGLTASEIAALPSARPFQISSSTALLGCLYVREGATLGGRVLARKLESLCGPANGGRSFFSGTFEDGRLWSELCATLDRVGDAERLPSMIDAACATFAALETWLDVAPATDQRDATP